MTILQDPQGAAFMLWQARDRIGASLVNAPGALTLNQLDTTDPEAAAAFYAEVFGWTTELMGDTEQPYWGIYNGGNLNGGMMRLAPGQDAPPHWLTYFATADLEGAVAQVRSTGGQIVLPADAGAGGPDHRGYGPPGRLLCPLGGPARSLSRARRLLDQPVAEPMATACVRVDASSLARIRFVWVRTVSVERPRSFATASVCMPSASICRICALARR